MKKNIVSFVWQTGTPVGLVEDRLPLTGYEPPIRKLKHISAQVIFISMSCTFLILRPIYVLKIRSLYRLYL